MRIYLHFILVSFFMLGIAPRMAAQGFQMAYGGTAADEGRAIAATADGGMLVTGVFTSAGGGQDLWAMKLNAAGEVEWSRLVGGGAAQLGWCLAPYGSDFFVGGLDNVVGLGQEGLLTRLDASGTPAWIMNYGDASDDVFWLLAVTADNKLWASGYTTGIGANDIAVLKLDGSGAVVWQRTYGQGANEFVHDIEPTADYGVLNVGYRRDYLPLTNYTGYLLRLDSTGNALWAYDYDIGAQEEYFESAVSTLDGGHTICGATNSVGAGGYDGWLVHVDSLGVVQWSHFYGLAGNEYFNSIVQSADGGYVMSGYTTSAGSGGTDFLLVKVDASGTLQWARTLGGPGTDYCQNATSNLVAMPAGYALVGQTNSFGAGGSDLFVARTDLNGFADSCFQTSPLLISGTPTVTRSAFAFTEITPAWGTPSGLTTTSPTPDTTIVCCPRPLAAIDVAGTCGSLTFTFTDSSLGVGAGSTWAWDFNADLTPDAFGPGPHSYTFPGAGAFPIGLLVQNACGKTDTAIVLVTASMGGVVLTTTSCDVSCNGAGDGTATVSATGMGPFSYLWSTVPPATGATVTGLDPGTYTVIVTDSGLGCADTASVTITEPAPVLLALAADSAGCSGASGTASVSPSGGNGNFSYLWSTGSTDSLITGLGTGMYYVTVTDTFSCSPSSLVYFQDFEGAHGWTLNVPTGVNGADNNFWEVDDDESGVAPPGCGAAGLGNRSMHVTSVFCPTCGAAYDAGGLCGILFCPETNMATYSPAISTVGFTGLTLSFDFISNGDALLDNASVFYNDGSGWALLSPSIKSPLCLGGQGQWTNISFPLPASCEGIPNLQIGFNWSNNDDGVGTDPSVAINDVRISSLSTPPVLCTYVDSVFVPDGGSLSLAMSAIPAACGGTGSAMVEVIGSGGPYAYLWSTGGTTDSIGGLAPGVYYVTVTDTLSGGGGGGPSIDTIYFETFDPAGAWTLNVPTGVNGANPNFWQIDDDESGVAPPGCGAAGLGNNSLHITSEFCPTCGAAYDAGGLCGILFCPETNMAAYSPNISTLGFSNLTLSFDFISNGDALLDNASVFYNDGSGWALLSPSIKSPLCLGGQGQWTNISYPLPASCWGIPNLQIGFNWSNNDDGVGTDPSVAINNLIITRPDTLGGGGGPILCTAVDSIVVPSSGGPVLVTVDDSVSCGTATGTAAVSVTSVGGPYSYLWSTGDTLDTVTGLGAGIYYVTVTDTIWSPGGGGPTLDTIYLETFDPAGAWTLNVPTGVNGVDNNFWQIDDDESGVAPPGCGAAGLGNNSLHITSVFCPTCGAAYDAGGLCGILFCPETNMAAYSPPISTVGFSNLSVSFDFISNGDALLDNASVFYNDGSGWALLSPSIKSPLCLGGQGQWTNISYPLPASCWGIPNLQIGFNWSNNDDGVGADPSVAINNLIITRPDTSGGPPTFTLCTSVDSVTIIDLGGPTLVTTGDTVSCDTTSGMVTVSVTSPGGPYAYLWSTGATTDTVTGLSPGMYYVTVTDTLSGGGGSIILDSIYFETFDPAGAWTLNVPTGVNGADNNFWQIDDDESGVAPPGCGAAGLGNNSLHITSVFCPTCGAAYDAGGLCGILFCPETNMRAESPLISTVGFSNLTLSFDFISNGDALLDNASVEYNDGSGWAVLSPSIKSALCLGGQGQWTNISFALPASCWGIPNLQVGFNWTNNDDGVGTDPSVAINNVVITRPDTIPGGTLVLCSSVDSAEVIYIPDSLVVDADGTGVTCDGVDDGTVSVTVISGVGPFTYDWSTGDTTVGVDSLGFGWYYVTVTNAEGCTDIDSFEVTAPDPIVLVMSSTPAPCSLATGTATVVATGGNPPLTYDWSTGGSTPTIFGLLPGTYTVTVTDALGCFSIGSVNVLGTLGPVVDAGPPSSFCEGDGGVQLFGTAVGGTAPYYWSWWCATPPCGIDSTFDDDPIVNPDFSMWYYVQVTDFNGCTSQVDSVFITVHPKPIVDAGPDLWICAPPAPCEILSPTVSGSAGPFSYQWSPSLGLSNDTIASPCVRPDTTTIYTLQVTDLTTGCRSSATTTDTLSSITVHVNPVPVAEAGPDRDLCFGDTLMLLGVGYGAGPVYDYEWSPFTPPVTLSDNDIPNPLAWPDLTTDYVLVVWSNGCPSYGDTVTVNVHTNPTVDAGPDRDICQGESVLLDATASGDPTSSFYTYAWFDPSTLDNASLEDPTATPDTTTTYYVYGYSEFGCESPMDSVLVTVKSTPIPDAGDPLVICEGDSIVIPASFYYDGTLPADPSTVWPAWTPALNINDTTLLQPTVWPTSSGFYYIALTHNTCTTFDSVLVTVIPGPQITLDADTSIFCEGQTTQLHASGGLGGASFSWSPGYGLSDSTATDPFASPDSTTTYIITLEEGGCSSQDTVTLTVIPLPEMAYFSSQNTGCAPLTVSFLEDVKDELHHIWNFGDGSISNDPSPTHTYMQPGTYVVTLTAVNTGGCEATLDTLIITVTDPGTAEFSSDPSFPADLSLPATTVQFTDESVNATSWVWDFGDGSSSSLENPAHTYTQIGDFTVTLTIRNPDGCISQVSHGPYIVRSPDLFIPNVFSPNEDNNNDVWLVRYTGDQPFQANILDRWGNQLWSTRNKTEGWKGLGPNGQQVPDGVYFYRVVVGNQEYAGDVTLLR